MGFAQDTQRSHTLNGQKPTLEGINKQKNKNQSVKA
jgi:hypothetical protein